MSWCLPPRFANQFLDAIKDGSIDPGKLVDMTSAERRTFFSDIVGAENAKSVNAMFEQKMLLKDVQKGMVSWAKSVAGITEPVRRDMVNKIMKMDKILNPAEEKDFLADLAAKKLGTQVTVEEAGKITQLAQKAVEEREKSAGSTFGASEGFVKAAAALEHYVRSLEPTTVVAEVRDNFVTTLRNIVLMNPSTPIKTTIGQLENSAIEAITRRLGAREMTGAAPTVRKDLSDQAWEFFKKTGFNPAIMESYEDSGKLGEHSNFDVPEGMMSSHPLLNKLESMTRTIAKVTNKIAIDWEHVYSFTKFHQLAFFDALHIGATNVATMEGLTGAKASARTEEIMRDAAKIKPETEPGRILRANAQEQAARVTSINDTYLAGFAMAVKRFLNNKLNFKAPGSKNSQGLGDLLMPVAKIPANIIWNGIENAGVGIPLAVNDLWQGKQKLASDDATTKLQGAAQYADGWRRMARVVGVLGASAIFASMFDPKKDFRFDRYGASFVKIGGVWINTEYITFMSPAMGGFLNARKQVKHNDSIVKMIESYGAGALTPLKHTPGVDTVSDFVTSLTSNKDQLAGAWEYLRGRMVPAPVHSLTQDRPVNRLLFGAHGVETEEDVRADKRADHLRAAQRRRAAAEFRAE